MIIFTRLLQFPAPAFSYNYLLFIIFHHLTSVTWQNRFYLQWFLWWSIIHYTGKYSGHTGNTGKYSGHKFWKNSALVLIVNVWNFSRASSVFMVLMVRLFLQLIFDSVSIRDRRHLHFFHKSFSSGILHSSLFDAFSVRSPFFRKSKQVNLNQYHRTVASSNTQNLKLAKIKLYFIVHCLRIFTTHFSCFSSVWSS